MTKIEIYSTEFCPYCIRAKQLLDNKNAHYVEIRVDTDKSKLVEMLRRSQGRRSVPQIFINDVGIGGFDDLAALESSGKLNEMLG